MRSTILAVLICLCAWSGTAVGSGTLRAVTSPDDEDTDKIAAFTSLVNTTTQMLDATEQSSGAGNTFRQSLANLNILFSELDEIDLVAPHVDVQTSTTLSNDFGEPTAFQLAAASGLLRFQSRILFKIAPPFVPGGVPVNITVPYAMTDFGTEGASASVSLQVFNDDEARVFDEHRVLGVDPSEGQFDLSGLVEPLVPSEIWIDANAVSVPPQLGAGGGTSHSEAQAIIGTDTFSFPPPGSPPALVAAASQAPSVMTFEFDQAAFDAIHGANSFILDDYLAFEFSGNLIPEPGGGLLVMAGLMGLAALRRRRS